MDNSNKLVSIKNPCHHSWSKMDLNSTGRHCALCDKTVVDFTAMTNDEIKFYFNTTAGGGTCGRFNSSQVVTKQNYIQRKLSETYLYIDSKISHRLIKVSMLLILSSAMTLTGCNNQTTGDSILIKDSTCTQKDTIKMGEAIHINPKDSLI